MKYRCRDCKAVYDEKPEYCVCGNNTFEEIIPSPYVKLVSYGKNSFDKNEIISWLFFSICLILALIILLLIPNGKPAAKHIQHPEVETTKDIPDIEKIWKESVKPQPKTSVAEPEIIVRKIIRRIEEPAAQEKTAQNAVPSRPTEQTAANLPKPAEKTQPAQTQQDTRQETIQKQETQEIAANPNDPALIRYKNILREVLLSKLAVGSISGEGTCIIEFGIDSTGKLINRKFVQYADNKPMNDAVYYMMMSVPRFKAPPSSYNGEIIRLKFYINNGAYEISFV